MILLLINSDFADNISLDYAYFQHIEYEAITKIKLQSFKLYFYSLSCSHCEVIKDDIFKYAFYEDHVFFVQAKRSMLCGDACCLENQQTFCVNGTPTLIIVEHFDEITKIEGVSKIQQYIFSKSSAFEV